MERLAMGWGQLPPPRHGEVVGSSVQAQAGWWGSSSNPGRAKETQRSLSPVGH